LGRQERRSDIARFRRDASRASLLTYMVAADQPLDSHPLLRNALSYWRSNIQQRRPFCPACKANFADDARPGAFLFATIAVAPTSASVSAFCDECWRDLPEAEIEREAARVLRHLIPGGRFLDHQDTRR
jgi:hypothetical protein